MLLWQFLKNGTPVQISHPPPPPPPPPLSLVAEALGIFDSDIHHCFTECTSVDVSDVAWQQAQLSPSRGGQGLRSLLHHSIASISHSGFALGENHHLEQS